MSAFFASASSQYLVNSAPPVITYPFTVGFWVYPTTLATKVFWSIAAVANTTHYFTLQLTTTVPTSFSLNAAAGGTAAVATASGFTPANPGWNFVIGRFISATNRRLAVYFPGATVSAGAMQDVPNTTSVAPVVDTAYIGCKGGSTPGTFFDGAVAEYWMTNTDIQPDGAAISDSLIKHLARYGPFSVQSIAKDIIDYRSFRQSIGSEQDSVEYDYFASPKGRQTWVNTNAVSLTQHPQWIPAGGYKGPQDFIRPGVV